VGGFGDAWSWVLKAQRNKKAGLNRAGLLKAQYAFRSHAIGNPLDFGRSMKKIVESCKKLWASHHAGIDGGAAPASSEVRFAHVPQSEPREKAEPEAVRGALSRRRNFPGCLSFWRRVDTNVSTRTDLQQHMG
jgi:hypothetical protein